MLTQNQYQKITTRAVKGMLLARLDTGPAGWVTDLAMKTTSDQASEDYGWLGAAPALQEYIGKRPVSEIRENSFVVRNKDFGGSVEIASKDMRRDKTGQIQVRINQIADRANDLPAKLLTALIVNGESAPCYDGQYFFDTDHAEGDSGSQSNDLSIDITEPTEPTVDEFSAALMAAIQQMYGFKDDAGEPMNQSARSFTVMVPIPFMGVALESVAALLGTGGKSNTLPALKDKFNINIVPNPRLSWTTKFAVFRDDEAAKPFVLQEEEGGRDVVALGDGSEYEQINKKQLFGVDWTGNVAYGYWQFACLVTFT